MNTPETNEEIKYKAITCCRICGSTSLPLVATLGNQCVASAFLACKSILPEVPLIVVRCNQCGLVQLLHTVEAGQMYKKYWYRSGVNQTMRDHLAGIAKEAMGRVKLEPHDMILDIGCNDGTLLASYGIKPGPDSVQLMGMDPAANIIQLALDKGLPVVCDFFSADRYFSMMNQRAKIITSIAMFYDLDDPNKFVADIAKVLHPEGVWVLEMSYLPTMLERNSFDTICHEHLEYYHLEPVEQLVAQHGLHVIDVTKNDMNGGSFRLTVMHKYNFTWSGWPDLVNRVNQVRADELMNALDSDGPYMNFRRNIEKIKADVQLFLRSAKEAGKLVHGYGASTKGNTILQFCGVTPDLLPAISDRNESKWGHFTVGTNIPIVSEEASRAAKPDYYFVLPWHFMDEFKKRETAFLARGGRFVVPMPNLTVITDP